MHNSYKAFKEQNPDVVNKAKNSNNLIIKAESEGLLAREAFNAGLKSTYIKWDLRYFKTMNQAQNALNTRLTPEMEAILDRFLR